MYKNSLLRKSPVRSLTFPSFELHSISRGVFFSINVWRTLFVRAGIRIAKKFQGNIVSVNV